MANIQVISKNADAYALACKLAGEGHDVEFYIQEPKAKNTGKGKTNPRVVLHPSSARGFDLILFDMVGLGSRAHSLDAGGRVVLGGGLLSDKLELDRPYGQKVAGLTKVGIPKFEVCYNIVQGLQFIQRHQETLWVFKPSHNATVGWTFVPKETNEGLASFMRHLPQKEFEFLLQEKIEGVEVSTEGWFNGEAFVCFNHTIERKRLFPNDRGPNTGCMGNVVWSCKEDKLVKTVLSPLTEFLGKARYVGPLDANTIVTKEGAWFLEWTARFGYDAIQALCELLQGSLFDFLFGVATKTLIPVFKPDFSLAVRLSLAPYPQETDCSVLKGLKVLDIPREAFPHVWLSDVMWIANEPYVAGVDGVLGCVTARGTDVRECRRRVYRTIDNITLVNDVQYRVDIGSHFEEKYTQLKDWGWLEA